MESTINKVYNKINHLLGDQLFSPDISFIYSSMDVTDLSSASTNTEIEQLCSGILNDEEKISYPAAVCFYPSKLDIAFKYFRGTPVKIAVVAAGFPHGQIDLLSKLFEIEELVKKGVDEIDIVLNVPDALQGNFDKIFDEIKSIKSIIGKIKIKVILEVNILNDLDLISKVSHTCLNAGADCIKTSTGKEGSIATPEAAIAMCIAIKEFYEKTGVKKAFKVAGGISDIPMASLYIEIVREVLGEDWLQPDLFRIGASRLRNKIIETLK